MTNQFFIHQQSRYFVVCFVPCKILSLRANPILLCERTQLRANLEILMCNTISSGMRPSFIQGGWKSSFITILPSTKPSSIPDGIFLNIYYLVNLTTTSISQFLPQPWSFHIAISITTSILQMFAVISCHNFLHNLLQPQSQSQLQL